MQGEFFPDLRASEPARAECGEKIKGNCSEQDFRIPKAEGSLQKLRQVLARSGSRGRI
jgi:hypothetical protein